MMYVVLEPANCASLEPIKVRLVNFNIKTKGVRGTKNRMQNNLVVFLERNWAFQNILLGSSVSDWFRKMRVRDITLFLKIPYFMRSNHRRGSVPPLTPTIIHFCDGYVAPIDHLSIAHTDSSIHFPLFTITNKSESEVSAKTQFQGDVDISDFTVCVESFP